MHVNKKLEVTNENGPDIGHDMRILCNTKTSIASDAEYASNIFGLDSKCGACAGVCSRSLSFEGDSDSGHYLFYLDLMCNFAAVYLTFMQFILQLKLCLYTNVHLLLQEVSPRVGVGVWSPTKKQSLRIPVPVDEFSPL